MPFWRIAIDGVTQWASGSVTAGPTDLLPADTSIDSMLGDGGTFFEVASTQGPVSADHEVLAPLGTQEVWASGVTFLESRYAREAESVDRNVYRDVYHATRPELFLKATPGTVVGPDRPIGIRRDSTWDVPEPELGLVVSSKGEIAAYTLGNDVSSRSIEGLNPLYLPQAKIYDGSCAIGPCLVPVDEAPDLDDLTMEMAIERDGGEAWSGEVAMRELQRSPSELAQWLYNARSFPRGVVLLTGTGLVPPQEFTLQPGDRVTISMDGIGSLSNDVIHVGHGAIDDAEETT